MLQDYRYRHHWILGQTLTGKTTHNEQLAVADMNNGDGVLYIDPHNSSTLLNQISEHRHDDVIIFDISDDEWPIAWNLIEHGDAYAADLATDTLKAIWGYGDTTTPQLDQIVYNTIYLLLNKPSGTFLSMYCFLVNQTFRKKAVENFNNPIVKSFWEDFDTLNPLKQRELTNSTLNKVQKLVADPRIRNVLGQPKSKFSLKDIMDKGKILIVRLPLQYFGEQKVGTLGGLILSQLLKEAPFNQRPFHVHIDDIQYFQTPILKSLLSRVGRNQVSLNFTSQYLTQLQPDILQSFLGNIGNKTSFRLGITDSKFLADDFRVRDGDVSLHALGPRQVYEINPETTKPRTLGEVEAPVVDIGHKLVKLSRRKFALPKTQVEAKIEKFLKGM